LEGAIIAKERGFGFGCRLGFQAHLKDLQASFDPLDDHHLLFELHFDQHGAGVGIRKDATTTLANHGAIFSGFRRTFAGRAFGWAREVDILNGGALHFFALGSEECGVDIP
jgi:hypothetical protein